MRAILIEFLGLRGASLLTDGLGFGGPDSDDHLKVRVAVVQHHRIGMLCHSLCLSQHYAQKTAPASRMLLLNSDSA